MLPIPPKLRFLIVTLPSWKMRNLSFITAIFLCLICYQWVSSFSPPQFFGMTRIEWEKLDGFATTPFDNHAMPDAGLQLTSLHGSLMWDRNGTADKSRVALSRPFLVRGPQLEVQLGGLVPTGISTPPVITLVPDESTESGGTARLQLRSVQLKVLTDSALGASLNEKKWSSFQFKIPDSLVGKSVRLELSASGAGDSAVWLAMRNKVEFFGQPSLREQLLNLNIYWPASILLALCIGFLAVQLLPSIGRLGERPCLLFLALIAISALLHLRPETFFFYDEFHVFERFRNRGWEAVLLKHNEHFLPAFFLLYFTEIVLLKSEPLLYLGVSLLLHAVNGYLLFALLKRVGASLPNVTQGAALVAAMFVGTTLHCETMRWIFVQSVILAEMFLLGALIYTWDYLESGKKRALTGSLVCIALAPLSFGNGFIILPWVGALAVFYLIQNPSQLRSVLSKTTWIVLGAVILLGITAYLYSVAEPGEIAVDPKPPFPRFRDLFKYLITGSQTGTVLRGLGFFPWIDIFGPADVRGFLGATELINDPELKLGYFGVFLSLLFLVYAFLMKQFKRITISLWFLGQWIIVVTYLLPAIGRSHWGYYQALSSRYTYTSLIGLGIILLPLATRYASLRLNPNPSTESVPVSANRVGGLVNPLLICLFASQLLAGQIYIYLGSRHYINRSYVERLRDWNQVLATNYPDRAVRYEGQDTAHYDLNPYPEDTLTLARHPDQVYGLLNWLDPDKYPMRRIE